MLSLKSILKTKLSLSLEITRSLSDWISKIPLNRQIASRRNDVWPYDNWTYEKPIEIRERANYEKDIWQYDNWSQESMTYDSWQYDSLWQDNWMDNWIDRQYYRSCQRPDYVGNKQRTDTAFYGRWEDW